MVSKEKYKIALVGTTSLRGREMKKALEKSDLALNGLDLYDPDIREEYSRLSEFREEPKVVRALQPEDLAGRDLVFFAADPETNKTYARMSERLGFLAVDLNESFLGEPDVPLVVSGINDHLLRACPRLVSNPHPLTIILAHLLRPLHDRFGLRKAVAFVLQPASAFDQAGIEELAGQSLSLLSGAALPMDVFKQQSAFNLLSHTSPPDAGGFSPGERQVAGELARVLELPELPLTLSIVQASLFHTYAVMCFLELAADSDLKGLEAALRKTGMIKDKASGDFCSVSCISVTGRDGVFVGQIKREDRFPGSFWVWAVADNLTRGSALNALEVAEKLLARREGA